MLTLGAQAPDFTLTDQNGQPCTLSRYTGQYVLVYFYPKDDTPGCTKEACTIRDLYAEFERSKVKVIGISADSLQSHQKFAGKYALAFTLLSDPARQVIKAYGALRGPFIRRISYLLGPDQVILKTYPSVDPAYHGVEIIQDVAAFRNKLSDNNAQ